MCVLLQSVRVFVRVCVCVCVCACVCACMRACMPALHTRVRALGVQVRVCVRQCLPACMSGRLGPCLRAFRTCASARARVRAQKHAWATCRWVGESDWRMDTVAGLHGWPDRTVIWVAALHGWRWGFVGGHWAARAQRQRSEITCVCVCVRTCGQTCDGHVPTHRFEALAMAVMFQYRRIHACTIAVSMLMRPHLSLVGSAIAGSCFHTRVQRSDLKSVARISVQTRA